MDDRSLALKWRDLKPDRRMVGALELADQGGPRVSVLESRDTPPKVQWSNRFADACARMVADEFRRHRAFRRLQILPDPDGTSEPPTFVAGDKKKKVDVIAGSLASGLQVGVSLKGMNFRDRTAHNFDKNLTGRTYELQDEVRVVHGYQPAAFLVGLFFMPLGATVDKRSERSASSFARVVQHLRARTGRIDPTLPSQLDRLDMAAVALYVPGDVELLGQEEVEYRDPFPRGVVRYFDVEEDPPFRGRPKIDATLDLPGLVDLTATRYLGEGAEAAIDWAEREQD